jgi:hypothetical protein
VGASTSRNPQGLSRPVIGLLYLFMKQQLQMDSNYRLTEKVTEFFTLVYKDDTMIIVKVKVHPITGPAGPRGGVHV